MTATALNSLLLDVGVRLKLAGSAATPESLLSVLAQDSVVTVRKAVALNPSASAETDQQLVGDADRSVRMLLAQKMVGLGAAPAEGRPGGPLSPGEHAAISSRAYDVLATLVQDEAVRIRRMLAEELARLPNAPHAIILALARDTVISVSEPVLRLSPMLSSADLLALLETPPHAAANTAIARRLNLPEIVSDAIAVSNDDGAIRTLLANSSAAIREKTLDALIGRAAKKPDWHEPLVRRPALPDHAARALSEIVAGNLLKMLADRTDLGAAVMTELKLRLAGRLTKPARADAEIAAEDDGALTIAHDRAMLEEARRLDERGELNEAVLLNAARHGQARWAAILLAVAAGMPLSVVDHASALRSAKALVSLVWKAGFTMAVAPAVQSVLGQLGPAAILAAGAGQDFPLGTDEMKWQLDFLGAGPR